MLQQATQLAQKKKGLDFAMSENGEKTPHKLNF